VTTSLILIAMLLAQGAPPAANAEAKSRAKVLLGEGTSLYDKGEFAPALERFTQAYADYASPKLLYNIAQTKRALGRLAEAMDAFERFLLEPPTDSPEMTADANAMMAELQAKLGRLHIDCSMARAEISVDGKVVGLSPLPDLLWAEPGQHQLTARHADAIPFVENVEVSIGAIRKVEIQLQRLGPTADVARSKTQNGRARLAKHVDAPSLPAMDSALVQTSDASPGWWLGRKWTWVAAGSTVVLAGAATVIGLSMQSKFDSLNQSCGSANTGYPGCSEGDISGVTTRKNAANILWALSGAAAVTTGILFVVEGRRVDFVPVAGASPGLTARLTY
jgi:hypothetical protein